MDQLIGYQIVSEKDKTEYPKCFTDKEVLDYSIANTWIVLEHLNPEFGPFRWVLLPVFESDLPEDWVFVEYI